MFIYVELADVPPPITFTSHPFLTLRVLKVYCAVHFGPNNWLQLIPREQRQTRKLKNDFEINTKKGTQSVTVFFNLKQNICPFPVINPQLLTVCGAGVGLPL